MGVVHTDGEMDPPPDSDLESTDFWVWSRCFAQDLSEEELREVLGLFVPQRDHWIDAHGAARWNEACRDRDQRK
jgi:hypothetical protein